MILFLISLLGLLAASHFVPVFISLQVMIAAAVVNFLNFSLRISPQEPSVKMLLVLGLMTFYLLEFSIVFHIYSNWDNREKGQLFSGFRIISFEKSDWWGEDRI
jgi:NADH:ubiquinone oxidoreductase subunit K